MPAPKVFRAREIETTEEELAAKTAAGPIKNESSVDDEIPMIESDIADLEDAAPSKKPGKRNRGRLISEELPSPNRVKISRSSVSREERGDVADAPFHHYGELGNPADEGGSSPQAFKTPQGTPSSIPQKTVKTRRMAAGPSESDTTVAQSPASDIGGNEVIKWDFEEEEDHPDPVVASHKRHNLRKKPNRQVAESDEEEQPSKPVRTRSRHPKIPAKQVAESDEEEQSPAQAIKKRGRPRKIPVKLEAESEEEEEASAQVIKKRGRPRKIPTTVHRGKRIQDKGERPQSSVRRSSRQQSRGSDRGTRASNRVLAKKAENTPMKMKTETPVFSKKEYTVERVIDCEVDKKTKELRYLVKWEGYAAKHNTWEPKKNLGKCKPLIKAFHAQKSAKSK